MAMNNMYRIGDYVYVDVGPTEPYAVRRIDELQKLANGNVEVEVMMYYRRADLPPEMAPVADENLSEYWDDVSKKYPAQVLERELFLAKKTEKISATQIRGKCTVCLLHKAESLFSYIKADDAFFYTLVFDPVNKSLFEDRGEIKIGTNYQAEVPTGLCEAETDTRKCSDLEELVWSPDNKLTDTQIDQFLVLARSVGTFARAVDEASTLKQPSLHMSAAAASRDITLFNAMGLLHDNNYDFALSALSLVANKSPRLSTDQMEEWSTAEASLFEEAMEKHGKTFNEIWSEHLPWKTVKNLVDYYYTWKTTDRYVQQKRLKAAEHETKLKQVYVPDYSKHEGAIPGHLLPSAICICCKATQSSFWYEMPGAQLLGMMNCRICHSCWTAYRRYAATTPGGVSKDLASYKTAGFKGKKATTLILQQTLLSRIAKKLPKGAYLNVRQLGRKPHRAVTLEKVRDDCVKMVSVVQPDKLKTMLNPRKYKQKCSMERVFEKCGRMDKSRPEWLIPAPKDKLPKPAKEAFPKPVGKPGGGKCGEVPPPASIRLSGAPAGPSLNRIKVAAAARGHVRNGIEVKAAPDDIFYKANKAIKTQRSDLTSRVIKKLARRPTKAFR